MTLDDIPRRNGLRFPEKVALVMGERRLTWAQPDCAPGTGWRSCLPTALNILSFTSVSRVPA